jgi:hypothetical protein
MNSTGLFSIHVDACGAHTRHWTHEDVFCPFSLPLSL